MTQITNLYIIYPSKWAKHGIIFSFLQLGNALFSLQVCGLCSPSVTPTPQ